MEKGKKGKKICLGNGSRNWGEGLWLQRKPNNVIKKHIPGQRGRGIGGGAV